MPGDCDGTALGKLEAHVARATRLSSMVALLHWDQQTQMPRAGATLRASLTADLAAEVHATWADARIGPWLNAAAEPPAHLDETQSRFHTANLRLVRREHEQAVRIPATLVRTFAQTTSHARAAWVQARQRNDFASFMPHLAELFRLSRQRADALADDSCNEPYDALLDLHEPGLRTAFIGPLLEQVAEGVRALIGRAAHQAAPADLPPIAAEKQMALSRSVAASLGFDFERGRLDLAPHPFCLPLGRDDVRLTSRFATDAPLDGLLATVHETGHGLYNQNLPAGPIEDQPVGGALRFAMHESQARFWENHVGRSPGFWHWIAPQMRAAGLGSYRPEPWQAAARSLRPGPIRTTADEAAYHLHIHLRCELERAMLHGDLAAADLPAAWAERCGQLPGLSPEDDTEGCLQDIHWAQGAIGYFPTYTLGSCLAAQLHEAAEKALGPLEPLIAEGHFDPIRHWLAETVFRHGSLYSTDELCRKITGGGPSPGPLLKHLHDCLGNPHRIV